MRPDALRLTPRHRRWLYASLGMLLITGAAWLALQAWTQRLGSDAAPHPAQPWLMKLHGAAAMVALVVVGALLPLHVRRGWRARLNRGSGAGIVAVLLALGLTGYGLYYAGGEQLRNLTAWLHDGLGLALPAVLVWHIRRGRASRRR